MTAQYDEMMEQSRQIRSLIASGQNPSSMIKARTEGMMESVTAAQAAIAGARSHTARISREMDTLKKAQESEAVGNSRATAVRPPSIQKSRTTGRKILI